MNLPSHILNYSVKTPVDEVRPIPSRVALNMKAVSSRHTVNHTPRHIVSQPTIPRWKCTRLLKLLRQNHVMCHRREKLNVLIHFSRKTDLMCALDDLFQKSNSDTSTLMKRTNNASRTKQMFNIPNINVTLTLVTETR